MTVDSAVLTARISEIRSAISELQRITSKPFVELSLDEKYSMRYNVVVLVESLVALCTHIAAEAYEKMSRSYREAVRVVAERLDVSCINDLESLVGMRNLVIHRYWTVEDEKIYNSVKANFKCVSSFLERVEDAFLG